MIDRASVKLQVKDLLRGRWGTLLLGLLLIYLAAFVPQIVIAWLGGGAVLATAFFAWAGPSSFWQAFAGVWGLFSLMPLLVAIFFLWPLDASRAGMFLKFLRGQNPPATSAFDAFQYYGAAVKAMAWRYLFTFLWSLLLVIPGIVKAFAYMMTPYIVADNPNIRYDDALRLSMRMTQGYKGQLFVMHLSFLGWHLLASLTFGILYIWLAPYICATEAAYYEELKRSGLESGTLRAEEFGLVN